MFSGLKNNKEVMRERTLKELNRLAKVVANTYKVPTIYDTNELMEYAIHEMKENAIDIDVQTLRKNWDWFKQKCLCLFKDNEKWEIIEKEDLPKLRQISKIIVYYNDGTQEEVSVKEMISLPNEVVKVELPPVKEYTLFIEAEDGLMIIRGKYKGKYVHEIDEDNFATCLAGWSKYQLIQNEELGIGRKGSLTDDDIKVLNQFVTNTYKF